MGDWSDGDEKWTPELRRQLDVVKGDDGVFCIELEDYWLEYCVTSVISEQDPQKYFHSQTLHNFNDNPANEYQAFYQFSLKREIRFDLNVFAISVLLLF